MFREVLLASASLATFCQAGLSVAVAADENVVLEEITVTALKRSQSIQDVPLSISALSADKLEAMGAEGFADYLPTIPSVVIVSSSPGTQRISIRGVSDAAGTAAPTQSTVGIYIDETVVSNERLAPDLKMVDIERVEVLRGPQGTLYGDASIGGTIRIITNKPNTNKYEMNVKAGISATRFGSTNYSVSGMINAPIIDDKLAIRAVGYYYDNDGFIDNARISENNVNSEQTIGGRFTVRLNASENLTLTAQVIIQDQELAATSIVRPDLGELMTDAYNIEFYETEYNQYSLTAAYENDEVSLVSSTSYSEYSSVSDEDFTGLINAIFGVPLSSIADVGVDTEAFSQEVRLLSNDKDSRFNWLVGAYYYSANSRNHEIDYTDGILDFLGVRDTPFDVGEDIIFASNGENRSTKRALFGQLSYELTEGLTATAGLRWFGNDLHRDTFKSGVVFGLPFQSPPLNARESKVNKAFSVSYAVNEDILVYASATEGYRVGGINNISPFFEAGDFPTSYQPDSLWNYEFGWNSTFADGRVIFNGALFYLKWDDVQVSTDAGGFAFIGNGGVASSRGAEFDISAQVTDNLSISFGGAFVDAQFDTDVAGVGATAGDSLPGSIPRNLSAAFDYRFDISDEWEGDFHGNWSHVAKISGGGFVDAEFGNYNTGNLRLTASRGDLEVSIYANNIWDERARLSAATRGVDPVFGISRPRTIGISLGYKM